MNVVVPPPSPPPSLPPPPPPSAAQLFLFTKQRSQFNVGWRTAHPCATPLVHRSRDRQRRQRQRQRRRRRRRRRDSSPRVAVKSLTLRDAIREKIPQLWSLQSSQAACKGDNSESV
ncbi:hypothetical protein P5V15_003730 [Pogonomyrmex californicus]